MVEYGTIQESLMEKSLRVMMMMGTLWEFQLSSFVIMDTAGMEAGEELVGIL